MSTFQYCYLGKWNFHCSRWYFWSALWSQTIEFFHNSCRIQWIQQNKIYKKIIVLPGMEPQVTCLSVRHLNHYTIMSSVLVWGYKWTIFMLGWLCPIHLIHWIRRKSVHFGKTRMWINSLIVARQNVPITFIDSEATLNSWWTLVGDRLRGGVWYELSLSGTRWREMHVNKGLSNGPASSYVKKVEHSEILFFFLDRR